MYIDYYLHFKINLDHTAKVECIDANLGTHQ